MYHAKEKEDVTVVEGEPDRYSQGRRHLESIATKTTAGRIFNVVKVKRLDTGDNNRQSFTWFVAVRKSKTIDYRPDDGGRKHV